MSLSSLLVVLCAALMGLAACAPAGQPRAAASPSAKAQADPVLPDYNSRLGSNRVAAEAASALGRKLYAGGQYWEVYVRTTPITLPGRYDPGDPGAAAPGAALVTATEVVIASESAAAIKAFGTGGDPHERQVLVELDGLLRTYFPNLASNSVRIFYGESFQHGVATFQGGRLVTYDVRKVG
jgi:hypothetical protein